MDRNGHGNGPEWTPERTGMDTGTDRNGPEDTMKSLALHPLFDIRIEKSLKIFTLLFPKRQIFYSSKLKVFADDNNKFDENSAKLSKWVENTGGKGEIASYEQFLLFPQCFQKTCPADP